MEPHLTRKRNKLNDYYEFPTDLDMESYTQEFSHKRDISERLDSSSSSGSGGNGSPTLQNATAAATKEELISFPKEYYQYRLKGVVLHLGTVESGHYTSLICDHTWAQSPKWYEFNDGRVSEFRPERMAEEAFGGQEEGYDFEQQEPEGRTGALMVDSSHEMFTRIKNAYMLIYERKALFRVEKLVQIAGELRGVQSEEEIGKKFETAKIAMSETSPKVSEDVQKQVLENTARNKIRKTVLNMDFLQFVSHIILSYGPSAAADYRRCKGVDLQCDLTVSVGKDALPAVTEYAPVLQTWKFLVQFVLTVLLRVKEESSVPLYQVLKSVKAALAKDIGLSMWLVESFSTEQILEEFFLYCPTGFSRFFVLSTLLTACRTLYETKEKEKLRKLLDSPSAYLLKRGAMTETEHGRKRIELSAHHHVPLVAILLHNVLRLLPNVATACPRRFRDLCLFLTLVARLGPCAKKLLLTEGTVGFVLENLTQDQPGPFATALQGLPLILVKKPTFSLGTQEVFPADQQGRRVVPLPCRNRTKSARFLVDLLAEVHSRLLRL
ncbi:MAG: hypothetical protein P4M11_06835 [Candidatus Pacebacteria bacterium]|nr:hypothetical protein [Candidatus Paceibacterota bacterium]